MLEIASQIFICLLIAAIIGMIIGYLLGQMFCNKNKKTSHIVQKDSDCGKKKEAKAKSEESETKSQEDEPKAKEEESKDETNLPPAGLVSSTSSEAKSEESEAKDQEDEPKAKEEESKDETNLPPAGLVSSASSEAKSEESEAKDQEDEPKAKEQESKDETNLPPVGLVSSVEDDKDRFKPKGLDAPRNGEKDDLKRVKGIGVKIEEKLNSLGIYHYDQIANWTEQEVKWVNSFLHFSGRIEREEWINQAKLLTKGELTEFAKRVAEGKVPSSKKD